MTQEKWTHHSGGYRDKQDLLEELFGRGDGDPDVYGYPDEQEEPDLD